MKKLLLSLLITAALLPGSGMASMAQSTEHFSNEPTVSKTFTTNRTSIINVYRGGNFTICV